MRKDRKSRFGKRMALLISAVLFMSSMQASATETTQDGEAQTSTEDKIEDANSKLDDLKDAKEQADSQVEELNQKKTELTGELADLNTKLTDLSTKIEDTQNQLNDKKAEIEQTSSDLKDAEDKAEEQYSDMKQRIRYIYENGTDSYLELILESESIADMLNRVEYVTAINSYDRDMLDEYENTIQTVADKKEELEDQEQQLQGISDQLEEEKGQVQSVIEDTQKVVAENDAALNDAQSVSEQYDQQIEEQKAYEAELEEQKAREDAEHLAEIKRQEEEAARAREEAEARAREEEEAKNRQQNEGNNGGGNGGGDTQVSASDQALLAALIQCEAGGEIYEGKLAVGSVVMNRVASGYYPNSVAGVIYQGGQFSPVASGRFASVLASGGASADSNRAASEVLAGNITNNFLFFRTIVTGIDGTIIGNHIFY